MPAAPDRRLRAGTRASRLALWQTRAVIDALQMRWPGLRVDPVLISTIGDRVADVPLPRIGDKGVFTRELEDSLREGTIDLAVHSLKDLPTEQPEGLALAAVLERGDPRDALVASSPTGVGILAPGSRVGTSSLRRRAQLLAARPDLDVRDLRGNVPTRVDAVLRGDLDAAVLALAGLERLDLTGHVREVLSPRVMLPAPGQGAMAVQVRADDASALALLATLDHTPTRLSTSAERALLGRLEGGCQVPVGALAVTSADGVMTLDAIVASLDGERAIRRSASAGVGTEEEALAFGRALGEQLLSDGAQAILHEVRRSLPSPLPRGAA
jgi:hydroxymethylbilane synthase